PQTDFLPPEFLLPRWGESRLHAGLLLTLALTGIAALAAEVTVPGFLMRAVGLGPRASKAAGIPVERIAMLTVAISGGFCGLAGAVEVGGVSGRVYENFSAGYGYT